MKDDVHCGDLLLNLRDYYNQCYKPWRYTGHDIYLRQDLQKRELEHIRASF